MKIKKVIYTVLLILWMAVIFVFSNQDAQTSQATSDKVSSDIVNTVEVITKKDIPRKQKNAFIDNTRFFIRKIAHFTLYLILGILSYLVFNIYGMTKPALYSIIFCFLYACSDEIHQMFLDGRTAKIMDVCIDTCGSMIGNMICFVIDRIKNKYKKQDN